MSLERNGRGEISFSCDECGEVHETMHRDFAAAKDDFKRNGGRTRKLHDEWLHFCSTCGG